MKLKYINIFRHMTLEFKNYFRLFAILLMVVFSTYSCDEDEFLDEVPLDFYSPENSYVSYENFTAAIYHLHDNLRETFYKGSNTNQPPRILYSGTDLVFSDGGLGEFPNFSERLVSTTGFVSNIWDPAYQIIYDANVIIGRVDDEKSQLTDSQKVKIKAEALFFRGLMHKFLADLYGGVPIVLEETTQPKRDYVRATRNEVYEQCVLDLKYAAENLGNINDVGTIRINNLAAYHTLAEVYISLGRWQDAITTASKVIDHPGMALMTERFGRRTNDKFIPQMPWASGGDVYWDLFRKGNQSRSSGNTESIWTIPFEYNVDGGAGGGAGYELIFNPRVWQITIKNDYNVIPHPNTYYGGRPGGQMRLTHYFYHGLWEKSGYEQDIRNADYNIIRDVKVNNPISDYDGKWVLKDKVPIPLNKYTDTTRNFFPILAKISSMGDHPKDVWLDDQTVPGSLLSKASGGLNTIADQYRIRLAETYLLRAEAYLGNNEPAKAADDINIIRARANAPLITAAEVDIDYILDERMRELYIEEWRLFTLTRLGKLVERTKKYNPEVGNTYLDHNNLWPIPYSEIEKNIEAELEQNPGYSE